jgi:hypothetical protein
MYSIKISMTLYTELEEANANIHMDLKEQQQQKKTPAKPPKQF